MLVMETEDQNTFLQVTLKEIQRDVAHIRSNMQRIEEFSYSLNKRLNIAENRISLIRGGLITFVAVFSVLIALKEILN